MGSCRHPADLRKTHRALSNMAAGAHRIVTKLVVRRCKSRCNRRTIFLAEKHLSFLPPSGLHMQKSGQASTKVQNMCYPRPRRNQIGKNTVFLESLEDIQKVKNSEGLDLQVWGSGELVQLLLKNDLVDDLWLRIYPLTLGKGKKLFDSGTIPAA